MPHILLRESMRFKQEHPGDDKPTQILTFGRRDPVGVVAQDVETSLNESRPPPRDINPSSIQSYALVPDMTTSPILVVTGFALSCTGSEFLYFKTYSKKALQRV